MSLFLILEARGILSPDKIETLNERIRKVLMNTDPMDIVVHSMAWTATDDRVVMCAASLAHHGLLDSVGDMILMDTDLCKVPAKHLASLVSRMTRINSLSWSNESNLRISNVIGCDMVNLFTSLKCESLRMNRLSLGREETRALVQAMESQLQTVAIYDEVTLDIEALVEYSGQGECREVTLFDDRYRDQMRTWARSKNWQVEIDKYPGFDVYSLCY